MAGVFEQDWLCSTVRPRPQYCEAGAPGSPTSSPDQAMSARVAIEGVDLYGLKMAYYPVDEKDYRDGAKPIDPLFGEHQLETIDRCFWFMGYVSQLPPNVRTYQLQGIWGEDVVQLYVATEAFLYFSTYGGADRNTPEIHDKMPPRIGDVVYIPNNDTLYEIVDVKNWEEAFGLKPRYKTITMRVYKDTKRTVSSEAQSLKALSSSLRSEYGSTTSRTAVPPKPRTLSSGRPSTSAGSFRTSGTSAPLAKPTAAADFSPSE